MVPLTDSMKLFLAGSIVLLLAGLPAVLWAPDLVPLVWLVAIAVGTARLVPREIGLLALIAAVAGAPAYAVALSATFAWWIIEPASIASSLAAFARFAGYAWLAAHVEPPDWIPIAIFFSGMVVRRLSIVWAQSPPNAVLPADIVSSMKNDVALRIGRSLTNSWEKENLPKLARALPRWVTPDHLTMLGLVAAIAVGAGYVLSHRSRAWLLLSIAGLFFHWVGDSLDGTLARVRKVERERYGYFVDRTADAIAVLIISICFGLSPFLSLTTGVLLGSSYLLIMLHAEICAYVSRTFPMSFAGIGPTEARIALALFTAALISWSPPRFTLLERTMTALDLAALFACALMVAAFVVRSALEARRLDRAERIAQGIAERARGSSVSG